MHVTDLVGTRVIPLFTHTPILLPTSATVRKLQQFKGVGDRLSRHLPWEIGDFRRFDSGKQFAAFFGLTPCPYSSGTMRRDQGISKAGRKSLRKMAVECAWLWYRWQKNSWLVKKWADRLEQKGNICFEM